MHVMAPTGSCIAKAKQNHCVNTVYSYIWHEYVLTSCDAGHASRCFVPMSLSNLDWERAGSLLIMHILPVGTMFLIRNIPECVGGYE